MFIGCQLNFFNATRSIKIGAYIWLPNHSIILIAFEFLLWTILSRYLAWHAWALSQALSTISASYWCNRPRARFGICWILIFNVHLLKSRVPDLQSALSSWINLFATSFILPRYQGRVHIVTGSELVNFIFRFVKVLGWLWVVSYPTPARLIPPFCWLIRPSQTLLVHFTVSLFIELMLHVLHLSVIIHAIVILLNIPLECRLAPSVTAIVVRRRSISHRTMLVNWFTTTLFLGLVLSD